MLPAIKTSTRCLQLYLWILSTINLCVCLPLVVLKYIQSFLSTRGTLTQQRPATLLTKSDLKDKTGSRHCSGSWIRGCGFKLQSLRERLDWCSGYNSNQRQQSGVNVATASPWMNQTRRMKFSSTHSQATVHKYVKNTLVMAFVQ